MMEEPFLDAQDHSEVPVKDQIDHQAHSEDVILELNRTYRILGYESRQHGNRSAKDGQRTATLP